LDFLTEHGFAHKIERLNAFVACSHPSERHAPAFMICRVCDSVAETDTGLSATSLGEAAIETGFHIERTVVEAEGVCPNCHDKAGS
jgi:Fur family zinc uptake transcriptional regulator